MQLRLGSTLLLALGIGGIAGSMGRNDAPRAEGARLPTGSFPLSAGRHRADLGARLPLAFEVNRGQAGPRVRYLARGEGYRLLLTDREAVLLFTRSSGSGEPGAALRIRWIGSHPCPSAHGLEPLPGRVNYLRGSDPRQWRVGIPTYGKIRYRDVYPGVDLLFYGGRRQLEYDFVVAPGADPRCITLAFGGTRAARGRAPVRIDRSGDLAVETASGVVRWQKPRLYQEVDGRRRSVAGRYILRGRDRVGFQVARYDRSRPLVIDPVLALAYSTYLGGRGFDEAREINVDAAGNLYVAGMTASGNFPTTPQAFDRTAGPDLDLFVTKLSADGATLLYSTYLGGSARNDLFDMDLDPEGNVYLTGETAARDFPTTPGAFDTTANGRRDVFVAKLGADGRRLLYSTYLGGSGEDVGNGIAVDAEGVVTLTGETASSDFPLAGALQPSKSGGYDAFVARLDPAGAALLYSAYLGGSRDDTATAITVDREGSAYLVGYTPSSNFPRQNALQPEMRGVGALNWGDAFVTKLSPDGRALVYSTYLGGRQDEIAHAIAVDAEGFASVAGQSTSPDFPTANAFQAMKRSAAGERDAFVTRLDPAGRALVYSTYLGGSGRSGAFGIVLDSLGSAWVAGYTYASDFPTREALQPAFGGFLDAFVTRMSADGAGLLFSTFLGGRGAEAATGIAVDAAGNTYVTGQTESADYPRVKPVQSALRGTRDAFVARIAPAE
jgi:hypothetical protein